MVPKRIIMTLLLLAAIAPALHAAPSPAAPAERLGPAEIAAGVRAIMDPNADPCRDFYQYA